MTVFISLFAVLSTLVLFASISHRHRPFDVEKGIGLLYGSASIMELRIEYGAAHARGAEEDYDEEGVGPCTFRTM